MRRDGRSAVSRSYRPRITALGCTHSSSSLACTWANLGVPVRADQDGAEETGLAVAARFEIGRRVHPVTGQHLAYIDCTPTAGYHVRAVASDELVEVRWLDRARLGGLMPDLFDVVREHISGCQA